MNIWFLAPRWGSEQLPPEAFLEKVKAAGYQGVEMPLPADDQERDRWISLLRQFNLRLVVQQWETERFSTLEDHLALLETVIRKAAAADPLFINSQTGKDYFTFEQNCRLLDLTAALEAETGVQIVHEIHRGKFSFHPLTTLPYLDAYPHLCITIDLSHWCCVCSSYLQDQQSAVQKALCHVAHIHARVGFTEGPQVNDFRAPEWREALAYHLGWWDIAIAHQQRAGASYCTITPEFGPSPYMPSLPYTRQPLADQWDLNVAMMALLKTKYSSGATSADAEACQFVNNENAMSA
jgi:sugar phosphate isomerase/epimerase